jgi:ABC-type multidrug transport system fused ATPase/permease subunit
MSAWSSKIPRPIKDWVYFLPLLRPYWKQLCVALVAMLLDAVLTVFQPWPLKVVIDRVLSHRPSRVPFIRACLLTHYFTHVMGQVG